MQTIPGVAAVSAYGFLAELGTLKQYSSRKLSLISGLTPRIVSSGTSVNHSCLSKRGSARVRQLLYLDCMTAVTRIPESNTQYRNLIAKSKAKMTARCACMRKLLLIIRIGHIAIFGNFHKTRLTFDTLSSPGCRSRRSAPTGKVPGPEFYISNRKWIFVRGYTIILVLSSCKSLP